MFTMRVETDNAAFRGGGRRRELARILRRVAERIEEGETEGTAVDVNGNSVGYWEVVR